MSNAPLSLVGMAILAVAVGVLLVVIVLVMRRGGVAGPRRIATDEPLGRLLGVTLLGLAVWIIVPSMFAASIRESQAAAQTHPTQPATDHDEQSFRFSPRQSVVISLISGALGAATLLAGNLIARPGGLHGLGLSLGLLPRGLIIALASTLIVLPLAFLAAMLTEMFWRVVSYEHPGAHEMLRILAEVPDFQLRALIYISAVLVAPVFEELLFRGHIQTLFAEVFRRMFQTRAPLLETSPGNTPSADPFLSDETPRPRSQWSDDAIARWMAITLASFLFTLVHGELWMMPPIFLLSLCLGYIYERTGNLWAVVLVHLAFNLVNVVVFVNLMVG